jgi:hypothetical protein
MGGASKRARGTEFARREATFSRIEALLRDPCAEFEVTLSGFRGILSPSSLSRASLPLPFG